ncbi:E3 ubiquitin-protein ligase PUB23 [Striga hermonthica]|uniref:U-box domain-containing protein n=1 Tax=Striga hermonthica TaxID=68872 RepID=A0A9N7NYR6_STRHE|nr:E3 ubiquitin-protein ligase PUB23 [Striga hermonthica]
MEDEYDNVEIPCYFICPISMHLMKDPVTVSTGITYDRESIEKWLHLSRRSKPEPLTCPVTKQALDDPSLTPNHTLRRLIQAWCTLNSLDKIPTPKPPLEKSQIVKILKEGEESPGSRIVCLRRLRSIAGRNQSSSTDLRAAGAVDFLLSVVGGRDDADEALDVLLEMDLSDSDLRAFFGSDPDGGDLLQPLIRVLGNGDCNSRARAMSLLKSAFDVADPAHLIGARPEVFVQTTHILRDRISQQASKAALKLLMELCPWGRNRVKAVESGAVHALVELLLDERAADRRSCELALTVLDQLCNCAEGRAELLSHGAGLAIVSKKILRVSHAASEKGVRIVGSVSRYSGCSRVLQEMLQVGVVAKLCLVQQVEANRKTKERAREILRLHSRFWRGSSCVPSHLRASYP